MKPRNKTRAPIRTFRVNPVHRGAPDDFFWTKPGQKIDDQVPRWGLVRARGHQVATPTWHAPSTHPSCAPLITHIHIQPGITYYL